ncbi:MAG TPA: isoprenylcysteine carboxylmethyltransferase family protein [Verrucomicrobiae bacterium]|nr:isoprenylcysteine carboxylmethyltransferase family protein [Verrucomicrobiae bacterium]
MQGGSRTDTVLFVAFMCFVVVWRVWETFRKQGAERGRTSMAWSFYALFALSVVIFGGTVAEFFLVKRAYRVEWALVGVLLFVAANVIRISAIRSLGRYWSLHVEVREQHPFVREGLYRYVRHPAYLSFVLEHIAVPLVGNAWWSLAVTMVVYVPMIVLRLSREEAALVDKFGDLYRAYQQQVGALVPRLSVFRRAADA